VVNSGDATRSIPLGGSCLLDDDAVDRVELGPRSGAVLRSAGP
jgi:hypothetical protein